MWTDACRAEAGRRPLAPGWSAIGTSRHSPPEDGKRGRDSRVGVPPLLSGIHLCVGVVGCSGGVLLSHDLSVAVPSALEGLASGFGMGPGVSPPL